MNVQKLLRSRFVAVLATLISASGCNQPTTAFAGPRAERRQTANPHTAPAVEEPRATIALEAIEPSPSTPKQPAGLAPLSDRSREQVQKAEGLLSQRRFTEAAIELERALRYDPNHPAVHAVLSILHWQAGNTERAKTHGEKAIEGDPSLAAPHYVLGRYFAQTGDPRRALLEYRTALLCPDLHSNPEVRALTQYHLGRALSAEGYYAAALAQFEEFRKSTATLRQAAKLLLPEAVNILATTNTALARDEATAYEKLGQLDKAAEALRPVVLEQPQDLELAIRYANLLLEAGRTDEALAAAQKIDSDDEQVIWLLLKIYEQRGESERAIEDIRARMAKGDDAGELTLRLADVLIRLNRADDAAQTLSEYLKDHSDATDVRIKFVSMLTAAGQWERALQTAAEGLQASPARAKEIESALLQNAGPGKGQDALINAAAAKSGDFASAYLGGMAALAQADAKQAEALLSKAVAAKPDFAPAHVGLGRVYLTQYHYDRALETANRAKELAAADARVELLLATIHDRLDHKDIAEEHYRTSSQLDRSDPAAVLALAELYLRTGQTRQAQLVLQNLLATATSNAKARELLSLVYLSDGKRDLAMEECQQLRGISDAHTALARCLARVDLNLQRDLDARRKMLVEAMEKGSPDAATWVAIGVTYGSEDYKSRREAFLRALELEPGFEDALAGLFETDKELALDFESAAGWLEQLLKKRPNQHQWRRELAILFTLMNDFDKAIAITMPFIERVDLEEKDLADYRSTHIGALRAGGKDERITELLRAWAESETANRRWSIALGDHYFAMKDYDRAAEVYEKLVAAGASPDVQHRLIVALGTGKQFDRAQQHVLGWLADDPENDALVSLMAGQLSEAGQVDAALELIRNHLLRTLRRQDFQDWMVARLSTSKRHDDAVHLVQTLMDNVISVLRQPAQFKGAEWQNELRDEERILYPDTFDSDALHARLESLRLRLTSVLFIAENYRRASDLLNEWLEGTNNPGTRFVYLRTLAAIQQAEGAEEAAGGTMERALLLRPTDVGINNDLAYTWIDRGIRLEDAEPMIRYTVGRAPAHAAYLDTYGWLHYKKGDFAEAKKWLLRANYARGSEDPVIMDHLGDCVWRLGEKEKAIEYWNKVIELFNERTADEKLNADERRAQRDAPTKIEDASTGRAPKVAPTGEETAQPQAED